MFESRKIFFIAAALLAITLALAGILFFSKNSASEEVDTGPSISYGLEKKKEIIITESVPQKKEAKVLFVGDLMFDRYIRQVAEKRGNDFIFGQVKNFLAGYDMVVANLEGPITSNPSVSVSSKFGERNNYIFTFDRGLAETLVKNKITLVNVGNNHILNFGQEGLEETKDTLRKSGISYFGDVAKEDNIWLQEIGGIKIGFANYNQFSSIGAAEVVKNIQNLKRKVDYVVVYAHWGKEYETDPREKERKLGHIFIDAGADLVIGTHPHVIQSSEEYRGKKIYYSLGNFIFDQYFNPNATRGLAVVMRIENGRLDFQEIGLFLDNNGQTRIGKYTRGGHFFSLFYNEF